MARRFFEKNYLVLSGSLLCFLALFVYAEAKAGLTSYGSNDLKSNEIIVANQCGYALDEKMSRRISKSSSRVDGQLVLVDFYLNLIPVRRPIQGKLSFGCLRTELAKPSKDSVQKTTAADELELEDSGGRYARNIVWQRKYEGNGWMGTIAYVDSVSGDQAKLVIPDYFFVCPDRGEVVCFSFEVEKTKLQKNEIDRIPQLLRGIALTRFKKTTRGTSGH